MANQEQLKILEQGVDAWNQWRGRNPDIVLDLSNIDTVNLCIEGIDLAGIHLASVNLSRFRLVGLNLCEADLWFSTSQNHSEECL